MRPLLFRIGLSNSGARLAQSETQLAEHALALAYAQFNPVLPLNPCAQRFSVPKVPAHPSLARHLAQYSIDRLQLLFA
jgi:hypothetical protein